MPCDPLPNGRSLFPVLLHLLFLATVAFGVLGITCKTLPHRLRAAPLPSRILKDRLWFLPRKIPKAHKPGCCGLPLGSFRLTFYWLAYEENYQNELYTTDIFTLRGEWLGTFPKKFL